MRVGEVLAALVLCASSWDDDADRLLMLEDVYSMDVKGDHIDIFFVDGNTPPIRVNKDGRIVSPNISTLNE